MSLPETYIDGFHDKKAVEKMPYRKLGNTGLTISKIGFGGGSVSGLYNDFTENEAIETIRDAIKRGINYIDTAPYYGQGRSEAIIGKALNGVPRNSFYLSTKVGRYTKEWETMFDYSAEKVTRNLEESMRLLGTDYIDIVVVHDVEFGDMNQIITETIPAIRRQVELGKVRYIAISGYPIQTLWDIVQESQIPIDVVLTYCRDTLIDNTLHQFIPLFKEKGLGLISAAPTSMGLLTNDGPPAWHPANSETKKLCAQAAQYCKQNDVELGRLAVYHAMKNENCDNILVGNNNKSLLDSNIEIAIHQISEKELEVLNYLYKTYFQLKDNMHWEGLEVAAYKTYMNTKQ
ncbi:hypothetical protein AAG570_003769 [Ranatra chinensis]|uniref:NADP-dependent oxidoreductase domain-containing protein n=1 Tax=Ranatra chinensis TaxID=642074 RepID=A0ABD0Y5R2_9HEMI